MGKETNEDRLGVIANLLALQIVQDKNPIDSVWLLKKSGMKNAEISQVLDIPENAVRAYISNKKKLLEQSAKRKSSKKVKNE